MRIYWVLRPDHTKLYGLTVVGRRTAGSVPVPVCRYWLVQAAETHGLVYFGQKYTKLYRSAR